MFAKKTHALKERDTIQAQSSKMEVVVAEEWVAVAEAHRIVLELHIPEDTQLEAKFQKLAVVTCKAKAEVRRVQFELNMKIMEL